MASRYDFVFRTRDCERSDSGSSGIGGGGGGGDGENALRVGLLLHFRLLILFGEDREAEYPDTGVVVAAAAAGDEEEGRRLAFIVIIVVVIFVDVGIALTESGVGDDLSITELKGMPELFAVSFF